MNSNKTSTVYILVGVPGSGKSTWVSAQNWLGDAVVVSTDQYIEKVAKEAGKTYSEVFEDNMSDAVSNMLDMVESAAVLGKDIVWDQTSTTVKSRASKIKMLPEYRKIAVFFATPDTPELRARLAGRHGKNIPGAVLANMISGLVVPTIEEGFDEIWYAQ